MATNNLEHHWNEDTSQQFLDYGRYFIPEREQQMRIIKDLLQRLPQPVSIVDLCCGDGTLAEVILEGCPGSTYLGLDGSNLILEKAREKLSHFTGRVTLQSFELAERSWCLMDHAPGAVVSSMAIHHLEGAGKQVLFRDVFSLLAHGGGFIISDMVEPTTAQGRAVAADAWDEVVRKRCLDLDGTTAGLDFFVNEGWNTYRYDNPDDIDHPSSLVDQLTWLKEAGFEATDVHFMQAGHALFSGWKI